MTTITFITGANKGLGYETARRLTGLGHTVILGARDKERGEAAAGRLGLRFVPIDVTDDASVASAAADVERHEGRVDRLINNAGITGRRAGAADLTGDDARLFFETNVLSIVRVTHAFLSLLARAEEPAVINVSSGMGSFALTQDPDRRAPAGSSTVSGPSPGSSANRPGRQRLGAQVRRRPAEAEQEQADRVAQHGHRGG
jgi:NAD(P)-dependent dehydrogenase (short-subunit alcohol dehydrogenase family)